MAWRNTRGRSHRQRLLLTLLPELVLPVRQKTFCARQEKRQTIALHHAMGVGSQNFGRNEAVERFDANARTLRSASNVFEIRFAKNINRDIRERKQSNMPTPTQHSRPDRVDPAYCSKRLATPSASDHTQRNQDFIDNALLLW